MPRIIKHPDITPTSGTQIPSNVFEREEDALHHYLLGTDEQVSAPDWSTSPANPLEFISLTGSEARLRKTADGSMTVASNYAVTSTTARLRTDDWKATDFTACIVGRYDGDGNVYFGNRSTSGAAGIMLTGRSTANNGLQCTIASTNLNSDFATASFNDWFFAAVVKSASDTKIYCPQCSTTLVSGLSGLDVGQPDLTFYVGGIYTTSFLLNAAKIAEYIYFDSELSESTLDAIYARSQARMSARSITLT